DVLANARDRGEFVQHAVDVHRLHGGTLQRGQQDAAQRVAKRLAEAAFERFCDQRRKAVCIGAGGYLELVRPDKLLPILLDRHCFTLRPVNLITGIGDRGSVRAAKFQKTPQAAEPPAYIKGQTRRRLRGRQPLCGIVVTSRIEVTVKPAAWSARNADSRPDPGPATSTSRVRMPCSC